MFTDERRCNVWDRIRQQDLRVFGKILTPALMKEAAQAAGVKVIASPLNCVNLVWLGIAAALHGAKNFADILVLTFKLLEDADLGKPDGPPPKRKRGTSKHNPHGRKLRAVSEEAFVQARQRMPMEFWLGLILLLAEQFQTQHPEAVRWKGFRLLALDGTELALPHWTSLAEAFGTSRNGRQRRRPQARMVMLAFPQCRLPWRYELTPRSCHEQTIAGRLLEHVEPRDLVLMDRGFWSYGLFWQVQRRHAFFGIRLRRGVKLKTLKLLGPDDRLVTWSMPKTSRKRCAWKDLPDLPKSLTLRMISYHMPGFRPSAVVTNVLDPAVISREDWVRMAADDGAGHVLEPGLYHRRWEIETLFCELKVRQGMARSLRSRTAEGIAFEVAGHVLLYMLTRWLMFEAAEEYGVPPLRISFTQALREVNDIRYALLLADPHHVRRVLLPRLLRRMAQHLVPLRPGRHFPRPADRYKKGKYRQQAKLLTKQT
jgi:Transposase DDE domain